MQMRSFKKMAREKKIKVLTLVVFLCLFGWFRKVKAIDVPKLKHFIRDGNDGLEGLCIASENYVYFATDWSYPLTEKQKDQPQTETYFLPNRTSDYDCNFEKGQICNHEWKSNIWGIPEDHDRRYSAVFDYRWEDFPSIFINKTTPLVNRRIDVHQNISITLSIRSNDGVKLVLCEGWLPQKYPCYTILIGLINGSDVHVLNSKNETIKTYFYQTPIFSYDQWRSFKISLHPTKGVTLKDLNENTEIVNFDGSPLEKIIFLFMESENAIWKIHKNNFLYTNISTNSTFGPPLTIIGKDINICMLVSMCEDCKLNFYLDNNLLSVSEFNVNNWKLLKVIIKNYTNDQLQLYSETKGPENGFWMIDNVRVCSDKEMKVNVLKNGNGNWNITDNDVSCHPLSKQQWRPKPYVVKLENVKLPLITKEEFTTSVRLNWMPERVGDEDLPFLLKYQGHHLCQKNNSLTNVSLKRIKSNDYILVEGSQITITGLVPYTHYSFSLGHLIYENLTREFSINTKELVLISELEKPKNVKVYPKNYSVKLAHQSPSCNDIFGRILYKYSLGNLTVVTEDTEVDFKQLKPFTNYTIQIETSRDINGFNNNSTKVISSYNFVTKPDVARAVSYFEIYETSRNKVGLRYKLPEVVTGIPDRVLVTYCSTLIRNRCNTIVENITECVQYPNVYCVSIDNLSGNQKYTFKLSVQNKGTHTSGKEVLKSASTIEFPPGLISNLTYKVINCSVTAEYCNLNVSWAHPWKQISGISDFEIELVEIGTNKGLNDIYTINGVYKPSYYHIVRYLPYATTYNISVRAINKYKGQYVTIQGKIDHIGDHIDQIPTIENIWEDSFLIQIPQKDVRIDQSILTVIVQNDMILEHIDDQIWNITNNLCREVAQTWIAKQIEFSNDTINFLIGDGSTEFSQYYQKNLINEKLHPDTEYCLTYVVDNIYKNISHIKVYHKIQKTLPAALEIKETASVLPVTMTVLTIIILVILVGLVLYRYRYRLRCRSQNDEHIYEGIPFDNYSDVTESVYNSTYDKLIHG